MRKEAERAEAVVDGDHDDAVLASQRLAGIQGHEPDPETKEPPWIQTITGSRSPGEPAGVQTFRYRQSSLVRPTPSGPMAAASCGHEGPYAAHSRTPSQAATGCGGRQRRSPTGGAA